MADSIALFPLGSTVLFPGVLLPLHIFEERYRALVRDLLGGPEEESRRFGVVAIRQGWEIGPGNSAALYDVGCTAQVRRVNAHPDGRYDLICVGQDRFRLVGLDETSRPYLTASVEWLPTDTQPGDEAGVLARAVGGLFRGYAADLATLQGAAVELGELPEDPLVLSHLVASAALLTLEDRQDLLVESSTLKRLRMQIRLLRRESTFLRRLNAVPVPLAELMVGNSAN
ncbi:LON peptidase substrate-binding domain-containing protein [soil metagenome]